MATWARIFLLYYSAIELVLDSTRYDSSYMRFNSFVSIVQVISAVCIVGVLVYYSVHSIRYKGFKLHHVVLWLGFLLSVGVVGMSEYFVQRYGNMYLALLRCYEFGQHFDDNAGVQHVLQLLHKK